MSYTAFVPNRVAPPPPPSDTVLQAAFSERNGDGENSSNKWNPAEAVLLSDGDKCFVPVELRSNSLSFNKNYVPLFPSISNQEEGRGEPEISPSVSRSSESDMSASMKNFGLPQSEYSLCGYLGKLSPLQKSVPQLFSLPGKSLTKQRWMVFSDRSCKLFYFKSKGETDVLGEISIAGATFNYDPEDSNGLFSIFSEGQTYHLVAGSDTTRQYWLDGLQEAKLQYMNAAQNGAKDSPGTCWYTNLPSAAPALSSGVDTNNVLSKSVKPFAKSRFSLFTTEFKHPGPSHSTHFSSTSTPEIVSTATTASPVKASGVQSQQFSRSARFSSVQVDGIAALHFDSDASNVGVKHEHIPLRPSRSAPRLSRPTTINLPYVGNGSFGKGQYKTKTSTFRRSLKVARPSIVNVDHASNATPQFHHRFMSSSPAYNGPLSFHWSDLTFSSDKSREVPTRSHPSPLSHLKPRTSGRVASPGAESLAGLKQIGVDLKASFCRYSGSSSSQRDSFSSVPEDDWVEECGSCKQLQQRLHTSEKKLESRVEELIAAKESIQLLQRELAALQRHLETLKQLETSNYDDKHLLEILHEKDRTIVRFEQSDCLLKNNLAELQEQLRVMKALVTAKDNTIQSISDELEDFKDRYSVTPDTLSRCFPGRTQPHSQSLISVHPPLNELTVVAAGASGVEGSTKISSPGEISLSPSTELVVDHVDSTAVSPSSDITAPLKVTANGTAGQAIQSSAVLDTVCAGDSYGDGTNGSDTYHDASCGSSSCTVTGLGGTSDSLACTRDAHANVGTCSLYAGDALQCNSEVYNERDPERKQSAHANISQKYAVSEFHIHFTGGKQVKNEDPVDAVETSVSLHVLNKEDTLENVSGLLPPESVAANCAALKGLPGQVQLSTVVPQNTQPECQQTLEHVFASQDLATITRERDRLLDSYQAYKSQSSFLHKQIVELSYASDMMQQREQRLRQEMQLLQAEYDRTRIKYQVLLKDLHSPPGLQHDREVIAGLLSDALSDRPDMRSLVCGGRRYDEVGFFQSSEELQRCPVFHSRQSMGAAVDGYDQERQTENAWEALVAGLSSAESKSGSQHQRKNIKTLTRERGLPLQYRTRVWQVLLDYQIGNIRRSRPANYYESLLSRCVIRRGEDGGEIDEKTKKQIELDLPRTLPNNRYYEHEFADNIVPLRRVLLAYALHNKEVSYCQGLNRLAAVALLFLPEVDAFWCLVYMVEYLMGEEYFTPQLLGPQIDHLVLKALVADKLPRLQAHLNMHNVDITIISVNWFLCLFVEEVPHFIYLHIWDSLLLEGKKVMFRYALAMIKMCEDGLLARTDAIQLTDYVRSVPVPFQNLHILRHTAFHWTNPLRSTSLNRLHSIFKEDILKKVAYHANKRQHFQERMKVQSGVTAAQLLEKEEEKEREECQQQHGNHIGVETSSHNSVEETSNDTLDEETLDHVGDENITAHTGDGNNTANIGVKSTENSGVTKLDTGGEGRHVDTCATTNYNLVKETTVNGHAKGPMNHSIGEEIMDSSSGSWKSMVTTSGMRTKTSSGAKRTTVVSDRMCTYGITNGNGGARGEVTVKYTGCSGVTVHTSSEGFSINSAGKNTTGNTSSEGIVVYTDGEGVTVHTGDEGSTASSGE